MSAGIVVSTAAKSGTAREEGQLLYILSASHSGSTLLAMLLGAQEKVCTVGELRAPAMGVVEEYQCSCGRKILQCSFWQEVSKRMADRGVLDFRITEAGTSIFEVPELYAQRLLYPLHRGPVLEIMRDVGLALSPSWKGHLREVQRRNENLVAVLRDLTGAHVVVDSSKAVLHLKYLLGAKALGIKVVHLVRDGRAVALSLMGHGLKRGTRCETVAAAAREWRRSNEAANCLLRRLPRTRWMQVVYEDLCQRPQETLASLLKFLGLGSSRLNLNFRRGEQHVLGNAMRLGSTSEIRLDDRWLRELSAGDLEVFERVAGKMNRAFGYGRQD